MTAYPLTSLSPPLLFGAIGAIFGPVRLGDVPAAPYDAFLHVLPMEQGNTQAFVQRQNSGPKPAAQEGIGNALDTNTGAQPSSSRRQLP